ncbi:MAG: RNA 2',3'-cyclic phosphodiesterase [Pseudooceanicola sp.]|nr:RNA 2',3'-cyclic phosphodiesterase [Pseudooceanicola sp.]
MRAFLAIPVPEQALPGLTALQTPLKAGRPADTFHLTLAFLGDLSTRQLDDLHAELETVAVRPFDLHLAGLDTFGGTDPTVLYIRAAGDGLQDLHKAIRRAIRNAGIDLPHSRFIPHVTLARFNRLTSEDATRLGRYLEAHGDAALFPFRVDGFALFRSDLHREGARHELLASYP